MISAVPDAMRGRPKVTAVLAVLLIVVGLTLTVAREAFADYNFTCSSATPCGGGFPRDTNGRVSEGPGDLNPGPPQPRKWHVLGETTWYSYSSGGPIIVDDVIKYDWPETNYINESHWKVRRHEHAHARGWAHGEAPDSKNDAYNRDVDES